VRWKASEAAVPCPKLQYRDQGRRQRAEVVTTIEVMELTKALMDIGISLMVS
jgi:hypothetical protein